MGPAVLQTGGLLGIRPISRKVAPADHLIVYPEVVSLRQLGLPTRSLLVVSAAQSSLFEDPARVIGVREYQVGDSPRHMHWTATARTGQLMMRRYQPGKARETVVLRMPRSGKHFWASGRERIVSLRWFRVDGAA